MPTIPLIRKNAPHLYLTQGQNEETFSLFVYIPLLAGTVVQRNSANGANPVQYTVGDGSNPQGLPFYERLEFQAPEENQPDRIDVAVAHTAAVSDEDTKPSYQLAVLFSDTDTENAPTGQIAVNCPYLYLTNPNGETENPEPHDPDFAPRCHVPLSEMDYAAEDQPAADTGTAGVCLQELQVFDDLETPATKINETHIPSNLIAPYLDTELLNGYFLVTVNHCEAQYGDPRRKRRGRMRNRFSDTH